MAINEERTNSLCPGNLGHHKSKTSINLLTPTRDGELLVSYGQEGQLALLGKSRVLTRLNWFDDGSDPVWSLAQPGAWQTETTGLALYMKGAGVKLMAVSPDGAPFYPAGDCR